MALDTLQCGFCTPGFIVEASAFHDAWRATRGTATPTREETGAALSGHLCRCGAYDNILRALAEPCSGKHDGDTERSPRLEARQKVTGAAIYTVDVHHEGQLEGALSRQISIGDFRRRISPNALTIHEQKQSGPTSPRSARSQYRI